MDSLESIPAEFLHFILCGADRRKKDALCAGICAQMYQIRPLENLGDYNLLNA